MKKKEISELTVRDCGSADENKLHKRNINQNNPKKLNNAEEYNTKLTDEVKKLAKKLGAEIVGVASVERFKNAPLMHSPQGLLPTAKSVVVVGVIWLDASIELTEKEISEHFYNPYDICESQTNMNGRLNSIVFNLSKLLEKEGYRSLPLPVTLYWRWRPYKTMKDPFAPPLVHRYAAVAAGLGEIGWHESFISPEYGPRQRLNSLITEAPLRPDPIYEGPPLCDRCMECVKACPYDRFRKEVKGIKELEIGGKRFKIPITNKWRCHLCYYQINPRFLPKEITEEVAIRIENDGRVSRGGILMDSAACLAACLPPNLRKKDENLYPHSIARKRKIKKVDPGEASEKIKEMVLEAGMDYLYIGSKEEFLKNGIDLEEYMPYASSIVFFGTSSYSNQFMNYASKERIKNLLFDLSHYLQSFGYYTLPVSRLPIDSIKETFGIKKNENSNFHHLITALPLKSLKISIGVKKEKKKEISSEEIKSFALDKGADLVGITSVERLNKIYSSLESAFGGEKTIVVENKPENIVMGSMDFNFAVKGIEKIKIKRPIDYLPDAKSVIVIGIHYPYALVERVAKPPAENIGPYRAFLYWHLPLALHSLAFDIVRFLKERGYKGTLAFDLGDFSFPRHTFNRFSAVCAGLGEIGWCGAVLTPEYGFTQRFVSIITDAELEQDPIYKGEKLCKECFKCVENCPVKAISKKDKITIKIENKVFEFGRINRLKCEWANRFGLVGEEGPKYMGSKIDILPPSEITLKSFEDALAKVKKLDTVEKLNWELVFERCIINCPVKGNENPGKPTAIYNGRGKLDHF